MAKPRVNLVEALDASLPPPVDDRQPSSGPSKEISPERPGLGPVLGMLADVRASEKSRLQELEEEIETLRREGREIIAIDPTKVRPSRFRDRDERFQHDESFSDLLDSIRRDGQHVPALVRPDPDGRSRYETVFGHRRLMACRFLGIDLKAVVREVSNRTMAVAASIENDKRVGLSVLEQSLSYRRLIDQKVFKDAADLATACQVSRSHVVNLLSFTEIPEAVRSALGDWRKCSFRDAQRLRNAVRAAAADSAKQEALHATCEELNHAKGPRAPGFGGRLDRLCRAIEVSTERDGAEDDWGPKHIADSRGKVVIRMKPGRRGVTWSFSNEDEKFARFLWEKAKMLRAEFERGKKTR